MEERDEFWDYPTDTTIWDILGAPRTRGWVPYYAGSVFRPDEMMEAFALEALDRTPAARRLGDIIGRLEEAGDTEVSQLFYEVTTAAIALGHAIGPTEDALGKPRSRKRGERFVAELVERADVDQLPGTFQDGMFTFRVES